ncbi:hypothetical protein GCM10009864_12590 [Streptomyces lunalinharesii]|uniref:Uncharacterized protein n=1 Tax=Streptomyces lunalinharesii TaxID=333384 RepID=A0ABP6DQ87_9ACTN
MGTEVPRSFATSGSRPIITNSVVPIPKAEIASASRAKGMENLSGWGWRGAARGVLSSVSEQSLPGRVFRRENGT